MRYYAVIDTNVLVSAMLQWESVPGKIAIEALIGCITPLLNEEILWEYREVLSRPKFHFRESSVTTLISEILERAIFVKGDFTEEFVDDPDDAVFYNVVMEARETKDAYLITGNIKHFPKCYYVVTPREMLDIISKN